jgi:hypothetical protein
MSWWIPGREKSGKRSWLLVSNPLPVVLFLVPLAIVLAAQVWRWWKG